MFSPSCLCHVTIYICVFSPNRGLNPKIITIKDWGTWNFKFLKPWKTMKFHGKKLGFGGSSRYVLPHLPPIPATNPPLPCHRLRSARLPAAQCSGRGRRPAWRIQNHLYYVMICIYIYIYRNLCTYLLMYLDDMKNVFWYYIYINEIVYHMFVCVCLLNTCMNSLHRCCVERL